MLRLPKKLLREIKTRYIYFVLKAKIEKRLHKAPPIFDYPQFLKLRNSLLRYVAALQVDSDGIKMKYSSKSNKPTLYSSCYTLFLLSLLGEISNFSTSRRHKWVQYFDSFQSADDGLFYDPIVDGHLFRNSDWWGARHLATHVATGYLILGAKPRYSFNLGPNVADPELFQKTLSSIKFSQPDHSNDIDNKLMNIGLLLEHNWRMFGDENSRICSEILAQFLLIRVDKTNGLWGNYDLGCAAARSRAVQFAYHLVGISGLEKYRAMVDVDELVRISLETQNDVGGFGVLLNSSACEDIDSIDMLWHSDSPSAEQLADLRAAALHRAVRWILCNQLQSGGFPFRMGQVFKYGHDEMTECILTGGLFGTWFRTLALAHAVDALGESNPFVILSPDSAYLA